MDRSAAARRLAAVSCSGTAFEALLTLRILNGGVPFQQFECGEELAALVRTGLPPTVDAALTRLRTPSGDHWSSLLALAVQTGLPHDVTRLLAMLRTADPIDVKVAMLGSDRTEPGCRPDATAADIRAAAAGNRAAVDDLVRRAETGGWDAEVRPILALKAAALVRLVIDAIGDLPEASYRNDASDLLERNALKVDEWLAGPDPVESVIERVTDGATYRAEPGISRVILIPTSVHRPWTLIHAFGDAKVFCYPARPDSELSAPDDTLIAVYRALGDGSRLRLLRRLVGGRTTVARLSSELDLAKSTVHEHLISLRAAGLVRSVDGGYEIEPELPDLNWMLKDFLGLEMRRECEACGVGLSLDAVAYICSYECTFCESCAQGHARVCPNCGGELVLRPRRVARAGMRRRSIQSHNRARSATDPTVSTSGGMP
jgi:hypothetical protein